MLIMIRFSSGPLGESPVPMVIGYYGGKWYNGNMDSVSGNNMFTKKAFCSIVQRFTHAFIRGRESA